MDRLNFLINEYKKRRLFPVQTGRLRNLPLINRAFRPVDLDPEAAKLIQEAFVTSRTAHEGKKRETGEPYFNHSYETAKKLVEWRLDPITIAAGLLHDIIEDTPITFEDIRKHFGDEVAFLVEGVTKLGHVKYRGTETQAGNLRKMILSLGQDLRVILIKLADRLHNMKTLKVLSPQKQKRIALETYDIYAPLAYRLGMHGLAGELEDLSFPYIFPEEYKWLMENIKDKYEERVRYLERLRPVLEKAMKENKVNVVQIDYRAKRHSSLYKKLKRYDMNMDLIYDLVAMRIIVETIEDCYAVLGVTHKMWPPLPGKIKDYIALPKPNGYQSIHTTVFCIDNRPTEFQIRTQEMHEGVENGIAAYWAYAGTKESKNYVEGGASFADKKELTWVNQLREWQKEFPDSQEFLDSLKIDFFKDRIFVITPKGKVIDLPYGSTPVDFAYHIHSEIGDSCAGARINGRMVPLDHRLIPGDVVEILIQKGKKPSESWLEFAKTELAKKRIKQALKESPLRIGSRAGEQVREPGKKKKNKTKK